MFEKRFSTHVTFYIATFTMMLSCLAISSPIPFYTSYQHLFDISGSILSFSTVLYFVGNVTGLLFFSRISNYIGRKKTIFIILTLGIVGCLCFIIINSGFMLLFGRLLQGLSCGMSAGGIQAYILDTSPQNSNLGVIVSTNIPLIGFSIGSIVSGAIVDMFPSMISSYFLILMIILGLCMIFILFSKETIEKKEGLLSSFKPELKFPDNIIRFLPVSIIILVTLYSVTGFYQTFSSTMAYEQFNLSSKVVAAIIYSSLIFPQILGTPLIKRLGLEKSQICGFIGFFISMIFVVYTLVNSMFTCFIISNISASLFCGLSFTSCMDNLVSRTSKLDMAGVLSTIYVITDGGTALSNLVISVLIRMFSFQNILLFYTIFVFFAMFISIFLIRRTSYDYDYYS